MGYGSKRKVKLNKKGTTVEKEEKNTEFKEYLQHFHFFQHDKV